MECFDNDEDIWNEVPESLETSNALVQNNVSNEKKIEKNTANVTIIFKAQKQYS